MTDRLDDLAALEDGWLDGTGLAPTKAAIETARYALQGPLADFPRPAIFPTEHGGLRMEWAINGWHMELRVTSLGTAQHYYIDPEGNYGA